MVYALGRVRCLPRNSLPSLAAGLPAWRSDSFDARADRRGVGTCAPRGGCTAWCAPPPERSLFSVLCWPGDFPKRSTTSLSTRASLGLISNLRRRTTFARSLQWARRAVYRASPSVQGRSSAQPRRAFARRSHLVQGTLAASAGRIFVLAPRAQFAPCVAGRSQVSNFCAGACASGVIQSTRAVSPTRRTAALPFSVPFAPT